MHNTLFLLYFTETNKIMENKPNSARSNHDFVHLKSAFLKDAEPEHQGAKEQARIYV